MIFAAGLGSRLAPLTNTKPKALVDFLGKPMLENVVQRLKKSGFDRIIINVHHFANMMKEYINAKDFGIEVLISDETDCLLDTGGGILKAKNFLLKEEDTLLYNVDIYSDFDLQDFIRFHKQNHTLATLAVKDRETTRKLVFDQNMQLVKWKNYSTNQEIIARETSKENTKELAFSGISIINKRIFPLIEETGKFSITKLFLRLAQTEKILGFQHSGLWADLGTKEKLQSAEKLIYTCT